MNACAYWTQIDFNEETRIEAEKLLVEDNFSKIVKRFKDRLHFKTKSPASIQRKMGCGFNRINYVTI